MIVNEQVGLSNSVRICMTSSEKVEEWELRYNLTESQTSRCFGIAITQYRNGSVIDCKDVGDISDNSAEIERLFRLVSERQVFPVSLPEVVDDWLCEKMNLAVC